MPDRYSRRDAASAFEHLANVAGARILDPSWKLTDKRREGAWLLDHNSIYGGYTIVEIVASSPPLPGDDRPQSYTAESHVFTSTRYPAREFCAMCHFAASAIGFARQPGNARRARRR